MVTVERNGELGLEETEIVDLPDTHVWVYGTTDWNNVTGSYHAYALFFCDRCGICRCQEMTIVSVEYGPRMRVKYTAKLTAKEALDHKEHISTFTAFPWVVDPVTDGFAREWIDFDPVPGVRP